MAAAERLSVITGHLQEQSPALAPLIDYSSIVRPFTYRDPATIPARDWLYGTSYIRQYANATFAPGGLGKTALAIVEALACASGYPLLGVHPKGRLRVWLYNGEDPMEELERRVAAAMIEHQLKPEDVEGYLFLGSGRDERLVIAEQGPGGAVIMKPNVGAVLEQFKALKIDIGIVDPFVSTHTVSENDNGAIDLVAKTWAKIAGDSNAAINLIHHTRKTNGAEITVEDGRGASALLAAVRSARVLNGMSEDEASRAGVENRFAYFKVSDGKANLAPRNDRATWYRFVSVHLGNGPHGTDGDSVGVVRSWNWPNHMEGVTAADLLKVQDAIDAGDWRESVQAKTDWAGQAVAGALGLDLSNSVELAKVKSLLKTWLQSGALVIEKKRDRKGENRPFVIVGERVSA